MLLLTAAVRSAPASGAERAMSRSVSGRLKRAPGCRYRLFGFARSRATRFMPRSRSARTR